MSELDQMSVGLEDGRLEIQVDERQPVIVGSATDHHKRIAVFAQQLDSPIIQRYLHQNQPVGLPTTAQLQQRCVRQLTGHETEEVLLFGGAESGAGDEIHFDLV